MSEQFKKVREFNANVLGVSQRQTGEMNDNEMKLSLVQLREEINELEEAFNSKDFVQQVDAIVDLQYYTFGILMKMGVSVEQYEAIFNCVHSANMNKKAGVNKKRGDHGAMDAEKPEGWVNPEELIARILSGQN